MSHEERMKLIEQEREELRRKIAEKFETLISKMHVPACKEEVRQAWATRPQMELQEEMVAIDKLLMMQSELTFVSIKGIVHDEK